MLSLSLCAGQVDHATFGIFKEYIGGLRGASVDKTIENANATLESDSLPDELVQDADTVYRRFSEGETLAGRVKREFEAKLRRIVQKRALDVLTVLTSREHVEDGQMPVPSGRSSGDGNSTQAAARGARKDAKNHKEEEEEEEEAGNEGHSSEDDGSSDAE